MSIVTGPDRQAAFCTIHNLLLYEVTGSWRTRQWRPSKTKKVPKMFLGGQTLIYPYFVVFLCTYLYSLPFRWSCLVSTDVRVRFHQGTHASLSRSGGHHHSSNTTHTRMAYLMHAQAGSIPSPQIPPFFIPWDPQHSIRRSVLLRCGHTKRLNYIQLSRCIESPHHLSLLSSIFAVSTLISSHILVIAFTAKHEAMSTRPRQTDCP